MKMGTVNLLHLILVVTLILSACSGGDEATPAESGGATSEEDKQGGTLVYGRGADAVSLDPINVTDGESIRVTHNIFETLLEYDQNLELQPKLATKYSSSEDGLTWTFELREGVKFHDGTDFNAEAVVFNFERWMDPENPYHKGDFPYYPFLYGGFKGDENHLIEHVKATGTHELEIKLKRKTAPFLSYLAISMFGIASPAAIEQYEGDVNEHPVGTGPFMFEEWSRNNTITLAKNPDYWMEGKPYLDTVIFQVIPENSARLNALQTGEIDILDGMNATDTNAVEETQGLELLKRPSFNIGYMAFNTEKEPFDDPKVRQAINMAINKEEIVNAFYNGLADTATSPLPPSLWGHDDTLAPYEYNVEEAKKLLAEAGYENGFETELHTMSNPRPYMPEPVKIAEAIQSDLAEVGITAEIVSSEWATYLDDTKQGKHSMAMYGWTGVMADPDNFLYPNLSKTNTEKPAQNIAFYKSDEFTSLITEARETIDQDKRIELYKQAQQLFQQDAPWVMLAYTTPPLAQADYVEGYEPHPMSNDLLTDVYLTNQ
ncbi:ABC transporter substrate-binding protein [Planomicrobium sp. CPCC 101110]|uniref:ABC transporter substrate-binding protein n=1 Tax=Planomicrobium sp. CPCC 101110 TaxID=2599619 RepID=UPI0011B3ABAD|nr:ABC transporter substrate-binding protein [Planomicrobium sp. CPCC 101110]TWT24845.1 ABC transporter substrate-binding protein [Planomicrobium sp. CPCC 101110]